MTSSFNQPLQDPYRDVAPKILEGIDKVGGHGIALLTLLAFASNPHEALTTREVRGKLEMMQPSQQVPHITTFQNVQRKLANELHWLTTNKIDGGIPARHLSRKGSVYGLALSGALLGWQIDYPEPQFALAKVLGMETVKANHERSAPSLRFGLYRLMMEANRPLSSWERETLLGTDRFHTHNEDSALSNRDIIEVSYENNRGRKWTMVTLSPTFEAPVRDLVSRVVSLDDKEGRRDARKRLMGIGESSSKLSTLMHISSTRAKNRYPG